MPSNHTTCERCLNDNKQPRPDVKIYLVWISNHQGITKGKRYMTINLIFFLSMWLFFTREIASHWFKLTAPSRKRQKRKSLDREYSVCWSSKKQIKTITNHLNVLNSPNRMNAHLRLNHGQSNRTDSFDYWVIVCTKRKSCPNMFHSTSAYCYDSRCCTISFFPR